MAVSLNPARDRLEKGELSLGMGIRQARSGDIAKAMKTCGFDWLFIDCEHNQMGVDIAAQIAVAGLDAGIAPLVRVPRAQFRWRPASSTAARSASSCRTSTRRKRPARWWRTSNTRRRVTVR